MLYSYLNKALSNIIVAKQALYAFKELKAKDLKNLASYNTQQAIELIIKHCIYEKTDYSKQIYSHDLEMLILKYCNKLDIQVPNIIRRNARMYTRWEAESRYDLHYSVKIKSIEIALDEAEKWLIEIKPTYKRKIEYINKKYK